MGDIVNLKRVRKARDRREREDAAAENRVRFGRTKAEKELAKAADDLTARRLDGHRRDGEPEPEA